VGPPVLLWVLVVALVIIEGGAGWFGANTNGGFVPEGGWLGAVSAMAFITVVVGWQLVAGIWFWGLPAWGDRYVYRKAIADLAACRVGSAVGQIEAGPGGPQARVRWAEAGPGGSEARAEAELGLGGPEARMEPTGAGSQGPQARLGQGRVGSRGSRARVGQAGTDPREPVGQGEVRKDLGAGGHSGALRRSRLAALRALSPVLAGAGQAGAAAAVGATAGRVGACHSWCTRKTVDWGYMMIVSGAGW
jgi:hypothetical protein